MTWLQLLATVWTIFGPVIKEAIREWFDNLMKEAADTMHANVAAYGNPGAARYALFSRALAVHDKAGENLWFWKKMPWGQQNRRRRLLERLREKAEQNLLTLEDKEELLALVRAA